MKKIIMALVIGCGFFGQDLYAQSGKKKTKKLPPLNQTIIMKSKTAGREKPYVVPMSDMTKGSPAKQNVQMTQKGMKANVNAYNGTELPPTDGGLSNR